MFDQLSEGDRVLLRLFHEVTFEPLEEPIREFPPAYGEIHLRVRASEDDYAEFELLAYGHSGTIHALDDAAQNLSYSFISRNGEAFAHRADDVWQFDINFVGAFAIPLGEQLGEDIVFGVGEQDGIRLGNPATTVQGNLHLGFFASEPLKPEDARVEVVYSRGSWAVYEKAVFDMDVPPVNFTVTEAGAQVYSSTARAGIPRRVMRLDVLLVYLQESEIPSLTTRFDDFLKHANRIWGKKGCIYFEPATATPVPISDTGLMETTDTDSLISAIYAYHNDASNVLPCLVVEGALYGTLGGGYTPIIEEDTMLIIEKVIVSGGATNLHLLAHELGHALGGFHSGDTVPEGGWSGSSKSILTPTSNLTAFNPDRNTQENCEYAYTSKLITDVAPDCTPNYDL